MYTNSTTADEPIIVESLIKSIQGPCGNSLLHSVSTEKILNETTTIPRIPDEQLIMEERYSAIDGYFGTVRMQFVFKVFDRLYNENIDCSRLYLHSSSI